MNRRAFIVVVIGMFICLAATIILTRPAVLEWLNIAVESNAFIGSTIGGISAPIVGLLTAYLLYITFDSQKNANNDLLKINRIASLNDSLQHLESFMLSSKITDYYNQLEKGLVKSFKYFDEKGDANINKDTCVNLLAYSYFYPVLHASVQILILVNEIEKEDSEKLKLRILSIIKLLTSTHAYESIRQSGIIDQKGNNYYTPEHNIEEALSIAEKWEIVLPKSKFSSVEEVIKAFSEPE